MAWRRLLATVLELSLPTVKDEATSADEELEGLLDMIVS